MTWRHKNFISVNLGIHWRLSTILKTLKKSVYFLICESIYILKVYSIYYTFEIKHKCLKIYFGQNKSFKKCTLFLSRDPAHQSFTFHSWFLYELKQEVCLSKTVCGIFVPFDFVSFLLQLIFLLNKKHGLFDFKRHNSFQN